MPKRKREKDFDYISDQIKKLKKKLKRARKQNTISSDSDSESKNSYNDNGLIEEPIIDLENSTNVSQSNQNLAEITNTTPVLPNAEIEPESDLVNLEHISGETANKECENTQLDKDILEVLGDDPSTTVQYGEEIHKELATRLQHITASGLTKETRKELQQKYLLPSNAILLGAPALNPEIKAALPETLANRDKAKIKTRSY
ncbi:uncharacterized protein LOC114355385 isoform X2 [Ostrinia furnacalis]|uniref:uncharacterized protein LOC114355385 isoform X2 n=1 Tax=Ostrinia furnacalis TaxID=93504 RepID=UPI00103B089B|nr:uncharacterized protein LOC114355385 isoform X2 [Ostrinia furnacalis]